MKVYVLVDNKWAPGGPEGEHGLSLYLESGDAGILFDTGQGDRFSRNAEILAVDLSKALMAVISHGHYDHGGGIEKFLEVNKNAIVYVHSTAFEQHSSLKSDGSYADISLDPDLKDNPRIIFSDVGASLGEWLTIFSGVENKHPSSESNRNLFVGSGEDIRPDNFKHEQHLIVEEGERSFLIIGCSHSGIVNIVNKAKDILGKFPDFVIGGFHLQIQLGNPEDLQHVRNISKVLLSTGVRFYTCHCTDDSAYDLMKEAMGQNIQMLKTGDILEI